MEQRPHGSGHLSPYLIVGADTAHIEEILLVGKGLDFSPLRPFPP